MAHVDPRSRVTLVTGASSGIGREMARAFARRGAKLVLVARREAALEALKVELQRDYSSDVRVIALDLTEPGAARKLFEETEGRGERIDFLVNNAGVGRVARLAGDEESALRSLLALNVESLTTLTALFLPKMVERRFGGVLQVASMVAFLPMPLMAVYAASKAYVLSLATALDVELEGSGVWVTVLCPGSVPSGFQAAAGFPASALGAPGELAPEVVAERAVVGFLRRERRVVPGLVNRLGAFFFPLLPKRLLARSAYAGLRKIGRV